jgi:hypothetical protein
LEEEFNSKMHVTVSRSLVGKAETKVRGGYPWPSNIVFCSIWPIKIAGKANIRSTYQPHSSGTEWVSL